MEVYNYLLFLASNVEHTNSTVLMTLELDIMMKYH
jgi:hypothetical protein